MNLDLASLFPDLEALTPDGRWELLQEWLRENPKYAKKIDRWVNQSPDEVFTQLCEEHGKLPARAVKAIVGVEMTQKILSAIETMQACYRERAGEYKAEYTSGWIEPENDQRPSAHKSIHDYQQQLKAKRKRKRK